MGYASGMGRAAGHTEVAEILRKHGAAADLAERRCHESCGVVLPGPV